VEFGSIAVLHGFWSEASSREGRRNEKMLRAGYETGVGKIWDTVLSGSVALLERGYKPYAPRVTSLNETKRQS